MQITDPIADMLTRIRNASSARHDSVDVPASTMKKAIAQILLEEGYIKNVQLIEDGGQGVIRIALKYGAKKEKAISASREFPSPACASTPARMSCPACCAAWASPLCPRPEAL